MIDDLGQDTESTEGNAAKERVEGEPIRIEAISRARIPLAVVAELAGGAAVVVFAWTGIVSTALLVLLAILLVTAAAAVTVRNTVAIDGSGDFVVRHTRLLGFGFNTRVCAVEDIHAVTVTSRRRLSGGSIVNDFSSCLVLRTGTAVQISRWHANAANRISRQAEAFADAMPRPFVPGKPGFSVLVSRSSDGTFVIDRVMHQSTKVGFGGAVFTVSVALLVLAVVMGGAVMLHLLGVV